MSARLAEAIQSSSQRKGSGSHSPRARSKRRCPGKKQAETQSERPKRKDQQPSFETAPPHPVEGTTPSWSLPNVLTMAPKQRRSSALTAVLTSLRLAPSALLDPSSSKVLRLPRNVAQEVIVTACLSPILAADIAVPSVPRLFATDSSEAKGAIVSASISSAQSLALWKASDRKGAFCRLEGAARTILRDKDPLWEDIGVSSGLPPPSPARPLAYHFDFLEVFSGAAVVTAEMARRGFVCGPPLDIDRSPGYDAGNPRLLEWVFFLIENDRVKRRHISPPCTTFSAAAFPALRSRVLPRGFRPLDQKTRHGTLIMALRALAILLKCLLYCVMATLEQPRASIMAALDEWRRFLRMMDVGDYWTSSCAFGSPHQKQVRFLVARLSLAVPLHKKHLPVRGRWAKASADLHAWSGSRDGEDFLPCHSFHPWPGP